MEAKLKVISMIDHFIYKASAVNKPYQAIQQTDEFKRLQDLFATAIYEQGAWLSNNVDHLLKEVGARDLEPLDAVQTKTLRSLIKQQLPSISDSVTEAEVYDVLKWVFTWSVKQQYKRWGYLIKASVNFSLDNPRYIEELKNRAGYLLNKSGLDDTTLDQAITIISDGKLASLTNPEVAQLLANKFNDEISTARGNVIARTETANAIGEANHAAAKENGATTKVWVGAGDPIDDVCQGNVDDGEIPINQSFSSGDMHEPAHPNCECYTEAGEINLDSVDVWGGE